MSRRAMILVAVLVAFTLYSAQVVATHGYFGFLSLAMDEPWAAQMLLDLVIALFLFSSWMLRDARSRSIAAWPYLIGIVALGSIAAVGYLIHRELRPPRLSSGSDARTPA